MTLSHDKGQTMKIRFLQISIDGRTRQDLRAEGLNASFVPIIAKKELLANVLADCL